MMATTRFTIPEIKGLMPSIEARLSPESHVIAGRNFTWDSLGPKSGFGAVYLTPFPLENPKDVQAIEIQNRTFVFTQDAILSWRTERPYGWELLYQFTTRLPVNERLPWQMIYLDGDIYVTHPSRGLFVAPFVTGQNKFWFNPVTANDIPGLPSRIKGLIKVRGRAIIVTDELIQWSEVGDMSDLTPGLAGAGFQRIDGIVAGTYRALTSWQNGFIVWTTKGAVIAEWIGGDDVWRFDPLASQERPLNAWCTLELSTGIVAMLTEHGLFYAPDSPQPWTPEFNEFFREYVKDRPQSDYFFRLDYDTASESVFVSESHTGQVYQRSFVLKPTLDKWGTFDVETHGFGQWTAEDFGYVTQEGFIYKFDDVFFRETEPAIEDGLDRYHPRIQKQLAVPSSSLVIRNLTYDPTNLEEIVNVNLPAWYKPRSFVPAVPAKGTLDSFIEVGYLRSPELGMAADAYAEFYEITVFTPPTQPTHPEDFTTEWRADFFYPEIEDWDYGGDLIPEDIVEDWAVESGVDDWGSGSVSGFEDWNAMSNYDSVIDPSVPIVDWNQPAPAESFGGNSGDQPALPYKLSIHASQDGITVESYAPELAKFNVSAQSYATFTSGTLHYLRFAATDIGEYYHVRGLELTMGYGGQQG